MTPKFFLHQIDWFYVLKELKEKYIKKSEEIRGPNTKAPDNAIEGFLKSNLIQKQNIYKKKN